MKVPHENQLSLVTLAIAYEVGISSLYLTTIFKGKGTTEFKSKSLLETMDDLKYLGTVGGFFFFITMDNADLIITKYEDLHFLWLKK